jgi:two-component system, cell cycle response regulator
MKRKVLTKLVGIMLIVGIILALVESYQFREHGISAAVNKAKAISEVVKNGLTSYMVNDTMDQRDVYINSISNMDNVEKLWIIRGEHVTKQFGKPTRLESPRDTMDTAVIGGEELQYELFETFDKTSMRVTIPYKAEQNSIANCISCHDVNYGDTLGAVSIVMDITDIRNSGLRLALSIVLFTLVAITLVIFFSNKVLKPHLETIEELSGKVKNISNGIFSNIIKKPGLSDESENLINEYNMLVNGLSSTFSDIDKRLNIFVGNKQQTSDNTLLNAQRIINNLSELYQFKKEIEIDKNKDEIYNRLAQILTNKFNLKRFTFMEQNYTTNNTRVVYTQGDGDFCSKTIQDSPDLCRVVRSTSDVISIQDHKVCNNFCNDQYLYYCTSIDIADKSILIINFVLENEQELDELKENISLIKNYFIEATPSLMVKLLLEALQASVFKDGLTGLYNRKFLDEHLTKLIPQALRERFNVGVLMLDMDHFKAVNDEYGHDIGDIVLQELGRILNENVRDSDIVVRYGGEEFVVLLVGVNGEEDALEVANKLRSRVAENEINVYAGNKLKKTISIGLSMFPSDSTNFDIVMKNADIALYDAKSSGRNQVVRYKEKVEVELF